MSEPTARQILAWLKRAETIKRKIEALDYDMGTAMGIEHPLITYSDNALHMSEDLVNVLNRYDYAKPNP